MNLRHRMHRLREQLRFRYVPRLANWLIRASTFKAKNKLRATGKIGLLLDNSVLAHGITHDTAWIPTGTVKWGPRNIDTGYAARIPVHAPDDQSRDYQNIRYLPGIASLARQGFISLKTSAELVDERFRQPSGRFAGYGYYDYDVFGDINIETVDGLAEMSMGPSHWRGPSVKEQQQARLNSKADPIYMALVQQLGLKNNQDAWHIWTAEKYGLFCFLTMDYRLCRTVASRLSAEPLRSIRTRIMTPLEFGLQFELLPVHTNVLSYTNASFPVRPDLSWPQGTGRRKYRSRRA
jgi:hypothetical protein